MTKAWFDSTAEDSSETVRWFSPYITNSCPDNLKTRYYSQVVRPTGLRDFDRHCILPAKHFALDEADQFQAHEKDPSISYMRTTAFYIRIQHCLPFERT